MTIASAPAKIDKSVASAPLMPRQAALTSGLHSYAPWTYTAFSKLHDFEHSPTPNQIAAGLSVPPSTGMFARAVLSKLREVNLPNPAVSPVSGGAIGMIWSVGARQLEVIFASDRSGSYVLSSKDEIVEDGDIDVNSTDGLERALLYILVA